MADSPHTANAAQLASRKIKSAKGVKGKLGNKSGGGFGSSSFGSNPAFASQETSAGNGLFGGGVSAAGTFNFSAPVQGFSFGNNSGTTTPRFGSDNEKDPRADTTGEEAARRNKPFQMVDGSAGASSQPFPGTFLRTPLSALGQPNGLGSAPNAAKSNPFQLARSESASPAPSFTFGSTPGHGQTSSNIFSLSQTPQPPAATEPFRFGTPPAAQDKTAQSIFSFGQTSQTQPMSSGISFGSVPAPQMPPSNLFSFGQTPTHTQPQSSPISFNSTSAPAQSTLDLFRQSPAPSTQPMGNIFGEKPPQSSTTSNMFSKLNSQVTNTDNTFGQQIQQPATPSRSLFGESSSKSALTSSLFSGTSQHNPLANNLFGRLEQSAAPKTKDFGARSELSDAPNINFGTPKPLSNPFGGQKADNPPKIFEDTPSIKESTMFGNQAPQSSSSTSIFSHLNKSTPELGDVDNGGITNPSTASSQSRGNLLSTPAAGLFKSVNRDIVPESPKPAAASLRSTPSLFGVSEESETILPSIEEDGPMDNTSFANFSTFNSRHTATTNIFSTVKPIEGSNDFNEIVSSGAASFSQPTSTLSGATITSTETNAPRTKSSPTKISSDTSVPAANNKSNKLKELADLQEYYNEVGEVADTVIEKYCPARFNDSQRIQFFAAYRLRSLNKGIRLYIEASQSGADFTGVFHRYIARREEILQACSTGLNNLKRKLEEVENSQTSPNKRSKPLEIAGDAQHQPRKSSPLKTKPVINNGYSNRYTSPEKENRPELANLRDKSPTKAQPSFIGSTTPKAPPPSKPLFLGQSPVVPPSPSPSGKRKAEIQITKDNPTEEEAAGGNQRSKLQALGGSKTGSATSSVFKNILDKPSSVTTGSPEKKMFSLVKPQSVDKSQSEEKPRFNAFANLPMPPSSPSMVAAAKAGPFSAAVSNSPSGPRAAAQTQSNSNDRRGGSGVNGNTISKPSLSQSSSNLFAPNTQSANLYSPMQSSTSNLFARVAENQFSTKTTAASPIIEKSIKPPTFGTAPVDFLTQFGQKSKKSMAEEETEAMEKAKMDDMDSDDDVAEWEANYKKKRQAEKKATEDRVKNSRASFIPGKGFTFGQATPTSEDTHSAPKSLLAPNTAPLSTNPNLFAPVNRSQASSPGTGSSTGSSIFDGVRPVKPVVSFGSGNIFGHLSDADSGGESGKGNEADDDTTDDDSDKPNAVKDDDRNDLSFDPNKEELGTPEIPGTPVEETGPGIAYAKKPATIFNFGAPSSSGTSTPSGVGGSLFDRISKDPNGNPMRQIPGEDKENAGPVATNTFGGDGTNLFTKYGNKPGLDQPKPSQDNTWKQDSPIKFGVSTSAPTVSVTAPTPTKNTTPFTSFFGNTVSQPGTPTPGGKPYSGSIFGNSIPPKTLSPAPTSSTPFPALFGSNSSARPTSGLFASLSNLEGKPAGVGFNFGAGSTTTSSLFPSIAGSATTSRATTPGGTTDGESTNGDPDAEHHEQIDLTTGGPGEENEDVVHQVRAKALKFQPSEDSSKASEWVIKGLGPLRILKNKETGSSRILLRADPSGTIVLNKGILGNVTYTATEKTLKLLTAGEGGQGLETWILQVKTPTGAEELAAALEANKRKD